MKPSDCEASGEKHDGEQEANHRPGHAGGQRPPVNAHPGPGERVAKGLDLNPDEVKRPRGDDQGRARGGDAELRRRYPWGQEVVRSLEWTLSSS
jgi:hypothetical protein